jgi:sugar phosphate permease
VPGQIGAQADVAPEDSGVASGLINTSQQIGGAIGVAVAMTIATTSTGNYVQDHAGTNAFNDAALVHGFGIALWVFAAVAAVAAVVTALVIESKPPLPEQTDQPDTTEAFVPAA